MLLLVQERALSRAFDFYLCRHPSRHAVLTLVLYTGLRYTETCLMYCIQSLCHYITSCCKKVFFFKENINPKCSGLKRLHNVSVMSFVNLICVGVTLICIHNCSAATNVITVWILFRPDAYLMNETPRLFSAAELQGGAQGGGCEHCNQLQLWFARCRRIDVSIFCWSFLI